MSGTKLYCVIGQPLGHSLSPLIHNQAFAETGTEGVYLAFPQTEEHLAAFFEAMRILPISGCNITLPFKVRSMDYVDRVSERARRVGAINTVYWQDGALVGENTDVTGFMAPLLGRKFRQALVLGAGGVSRAALAALQELGLERICLANRSHDRALELATPPTRPASLPGARALPMTLSTRPSRRAFCARPQPRAGRRRAAWPCSWNRPVPPLPCGPACPCPQRAPMRPCAGPWQSAADQGGLCKASLPDPLHKKGGVCSGHTPRGFAV